MADDDPSDHGVAAAVSSAVWLNRVLGLEVEFFGRSSDAKYFDCELVMSGRFLQYTIRLDHSWLLFFVQLMDRTDAPEQLFSVVDDAEGWQIVCRLVAAMERSGIQSLERPTLAATLDRTRSNFVDRVKTGSRVKTRAAKSSFKKKARPVARARKIQTSNILPSREGRRLDDDRAWMDW